MKKYKLEEGIQLFKDFKVSLKEKLKEHLQDDEIEVAERYITLVTCGLELTTYRTDFGLERPDLFLYEGPVFLERYERISVDKILEALEMSDAFNITEDEIFTFIKYCVDNCANTLIFDWYE